MNSVTRAADKILLFIPMYNCERQIPRVIAQISPEVAQFVDEVIVVNNRSTDAGQAAAIEALAKRPDISAKVLLNDANYGLGGSHKVAFNYSIENGFDYCIVLHGDDQGSISDLLPLLRAGAFRDSDFLLGARFMKGARLEGYSVLRTFGNHVFNGLYSLVSGVRIYDLGSGLNLYSVPALADRSYLRCPDDLTFNYQMILNAIAAKKRIQFFPITWREADQVSNVKLVRQSVRVLGIALDYALGRSGSSSKNEKVGPPARSYSATIVFSRDGVALQTR